MDPGRFAGLQVYLHHIKAHRHWLAEQAQPIVGAIAQQAALAVVHSASWRARGRRDGAFHFAHHKSIPLASHDIELAPPAPAEIAAQNAQPACSQV